MKRLLKQYFEKKLSQEPRLEYPTGLGLTDPIGNAGDAVKRNLSLSYHEGKTAPVIFGLGMAACIAILILSIPKTVVSENTAYDKVKLRKAVARAAEQMDTREIFPEGIRKINEFFVQ